MKKYAIIVAGGSGSRMGSGIPKQFRSLCGRPMLWWSLKAFYEESPETEIIIVLPSDFVSLWEDFFSTLPVQERFPHKITTGGETRTESVRNGLRLVSEEESLIAIHDGARPMINESIIAEGWKTAYEKKAAVPVVPVVDSLRKIDGKSSHCVDRSEYVAVQTPQVFQGKLLLEAYREAGDKTFSDDAAVVENSGMTVSLFPGNPENMKVTNRKDLEIASVLLQRNA